MEIGLECFDESGKKIFDSDVLTTETLGVVETHGVNGSITDDRIEGKRVWFKTVEYNPDSGVMFFFSPNIQYSGKTISWTFSKYVTEASYPIGNVKFVYGVF